MQEEDLDFNTLSQLLMHDDEFSEDPTTGSTVPYDTEENETDNCSGTESVVNGSATENPGSKLDPDFSGGNLEQESQNLESTENEVEEESIVYEDGERASAEDAATADDDDDDDDIDDEELDRLVMLQLGKATGIGWDSIDVAQAQPDTSQMDVDSSGDNHDNTHEDAENRDSDRNIDESDCKTKESDVKRADSDCKITESGHKTAETDCDMADACLPQETRDANKATENSESKGQIKENYASKDNLKPKSSHTEPDPRLREDVDFSDKIFGGNNVLTSNENIEELPDHIDVHAVLDEIRAMKQRIIFLEKHVLRHLRRDSNVNTKVKKEHSRKSSSHTRDGSHRKSSGNDGQKRKSAPVSSTKKEFDLNSVMNDISTTHSQTSTPQPWDRKKAKESVYGSSSSNKGKTLVQASASHKSSEQMKDKLAKVIDKVTSSTSSNQRSQKSQSLQKELFGDDDSDWSDLEGEKPSHLSTEGKEIHNLLKKQRIAHQPSTPSTSVSKPIAPVQPSTSSQNKPVANKPLPSSQLHAPRKSEASSSDVWLEKYSRIRISNPVIDRQSFEMKLGSRKFFKLSSIKGQVNSKIDLDNVDWVTIAVVVSKTDTKTSAKGSQYSIWRLNDLYKCDEMVSLFLFGDAHKNLWKTSAGSVVGILNPTVMKNAEKHKGRSDDLSLSLNMAGKCLLLGYSRDLGTCKSKTKGGKTCSNVVNLTDCEYCSYHVKSAYNKQSNKRGELQGGGPNHQPKAYNSLFQKNPGGTFFYQGQTFSASGHTQSRPKSNSNLMQQVAKTQLNEKKPTTLTMQNLSDKDKERLEKLAEGNTDGKNKEFCALLKLPTAGSQNFLRHLLKSEDALEEKKNDGEKKPKGKTASELLQATAQDLKKKESSSNSSSAEHKTSKKDQHASSSKSEKSQQASSSKSEKSQQASSSKSEKGQQASSSKSEKKMHKTSSAENGDKQKSSKQQVLKETPALGKGFSDDMDLELEFDIPTNSAPLCRKLSPNDLAMQKALAKIKEKGGIAKKDPNRVKAEISDEKQQQIKRRLEEALSTDDNSSGKENCSSPQPAWKKPRHSLLGSVNLDDPEVQKLLNAKSAHGGELSQEEAEQQEKYFEVLEKKEAMEQKMDSIYQLNCKAVICKKCGYKALGPADRCKTEQHDLKWVDAIKKFFKCTECKTRTMTLERYPEHACKSCGGTSFKKCSMLKEKKGPKLPTEELLLRGEERKFVNS